MGVPDQIYEHPRATIAAGVLGFWIVYLAAWAVYSLYFSPLAKFPGPRLAAATILLKLWHQANGNLVNWINALHHEYGTVVRTGPTELSFSDGQAYQDIYGFQPPGKPSFEKDSRFYDFASLETSSIINANDADHSRTRRIFSHAFSDRALKEQEPLLTKYTNLLGDKLQEMIDGDPDAKVDMVSMLNFTTFDIMGDLTFGEPLYMLQNSEYVPWVKTIFDSVRSASMLMVINSLPVVSSVFNFLLGGIITRARRAHFKYCIDRVNRRLAVQTARPDIWTQVLRREGDKALSLDEMHSNADLFMIAGTETTASLVSGLLYYLIINPDKMKKLQEELRREFKGREDITLTRLAQLTYLNACIDEAFRMYPPVPTGLPRVTPPGGRAICGEWIPENTTVYVTTLAVARSPAYFRDPEEFIPERWISSEYSSDRKNVLQPFSVGPRNCLGKNLAYHESRLLVAAVLHSFDLKLCAESQNWKDHKVFAIWSKPPLMVTVASGVSD